MKKVLVVATLVAGLAIVGCNKTVESTTPTTTSVAITTDSGITVTWEAITTEQAVTEDAVDIVTGKQHVTIVTGKQIGRASCRERVSSPV